MWSRKYGEIYVRSEYFFVFSWNVDLTDIIGVDSELWRSFSLWWHLACTACSCLIRLRGDHSISSIHSGLHYKISQIGYLTQRVFISPSSSGLKPEIKVLTELVLMGNLLAFRQLCAQLVFYWYVHMDRAVDPSSSSYDTTKPIGLGSHHLALFSHFQKKHGFQYSHIED